MSLPPEAEFWRGWQDGEDESEICIYMDNNGHCSDVVRGVGEKVKTGKRSVAAQSLVLFIVLALVNSSEGATVRKGPYLIYPGTNTEMMVLWQLDSSQSCFLEWGLDTSYSDGNAVTSEYL
jgi:hypothetical protein